jgi:hypothetical protein
MSDSSKDDKTPWYNSKIFHYGLLTATTAALLACFDLAFYGKTTTLPAVKIPLGEGNYLYKTVFRFKLDINTTWDASRDSKSITSAFSDKSWYLDDTTKFHKEDGDWYDFSCNTFEDDTNGVDLIAKNENGMQAGVTYLGQHTKCHKKSICLINKRYSKAGIGLISIAFAVTLLLTIWHAFKSANATPALLSSEKFAGFVTFLEFVVALHFIGILFVCNTLYNYYRHQIYYRVDFDPEDEMFRNMRCGEQLGIKEDVSEQNVKLHLTVQILAFILAIAGTAIIVMDFRKMKKQAYTLLHQNFL